MKRVIKASSSHPLVFDLTEALYDIAEEYTTSHPVSGDWDTETQHEMEAIASAFNIPLTAAEALMKYVLGFDEDML